MITVEDTYTVEFGAGGNTTTNMLIGHDVYQSFCEGPEVLSTWVVNNAPPGTTSLRIVNARSGCVMHEATS